MSLTSCSASASSPHLTSCVGVPTCRGHLAKNKKIIREVSTIARLHHRYIVRYFQAWIESAGSGSSGSTRLRRVTGPEADADGEVEGEDWLNPSVSTYGGGRAGAAEDDEEEEESEEEGSESDSASSSSSSSSSSSAGPGHGKGARKAGGHQFLYIQMEYCPNKTLRDLIDEKVMSNPEAVWRLFRQTLEAIAEIHRKG
jgi:translation initiation factor 2-alpha kinase 4